MALIALGCGIAFGLAPALEATLFDVNRTLKDLEAAAREAAVADDSARFWWPAKWLWR